MIRASKLAYETSESFIRFWRPENDILNAFLVAALSTLLAYQIIAITFDLTLGFKPRRQARISEVQTLVLARSQSLSAILASILRNDSLTRRTFSLPKDTAIDRDEKLIRPGTILRLLLLLLIAPVVNIISVTIALENSTQISLAKAKFGGVALGIAEDPTALRLNPLTERCNVAELDLKRGEEKLSDFSLCDVDGEVQRDNTVGQALFTLVRVTNHLLGFSLSINGKTVRTGKWAFFRTVKNGAQQSFHVKTKLEEKSLNRLADIAARLMAKECDTSLENVLDVPDLSFPQMQTEVLRAKKMGCNKNSTQVKSIARSLLAYVTFVESDRMEVYEVVPDGEGIVRELKDLNLLDASNFPLFVRRRRNLSFLWLSMFVAVGAVVHAFTSIFFHDDVDMGSEVLMKKALGLQCCDSGLWDHGVLIDYTWRSGPGYVELFKDDVSCMRHKMSENYSS